MITLPISTTNMTGLPIILRGFSFSTESRIARRTIFHSQIAFLRGFLGELPTCTAADSVNRWFYCALPYKFL